MTSSITGLSSTYALTSTITGLSSVYQPVGSYALTSAITALSSVYQPVGSYALTSAITGLSSIYQAIGNYALTSAITGLSTVYQAIGNYALTSAITALSSVYQTIGSYALTSAITGLTSIYAKLSNPTFTGTLSAPTINASSTLQVGGTDIANIYQPAIWAYAYITYASNNLNVAYSNGKAASINATWNSTGTYTISYSTAPSQPTACFLTLHGSIGFAQWSGMGRSQITVQTYDKTGALTSQDITIMIII